MNEKLLEYVNSLDDQRIHRKRKRELDTLAHELNSIYDKEGGLKLNFICTHNSRRSHLAQVWAFVASSFYNKKNITCFSGGTEGTAVYPKIIETLQEAGLQIEKLDESDNPKYGLELGPRDSMELFSKRFDDHANPKKGFVAIMTCSDADKIVP